MSAGISASSQDYLEAILELSAENDWIRSVDIAEKLNVSRASVNRAIGILKQMGYIVQERYSRILLTELGKDEARKVKDRHVALKTFLNKVLKVSEKTAEEDACKMEHCMSRETLEKLKLFIEETI